MSAARFAMGLTAIGLTLFVIGELAPGSKGSAPKPPPAATPLTEQQAAKFGENVQSTSPSPSTEPWEIHAEAIVTINPKAFACLSHDLLDEAMLHISKHEQTKLRAMFENLDCVNIPPGQKFRVLSTEYGVFEFVNAKADISNGMWTWNEAVSSHD